MTFFSFPEELLLNEFLSLVMLIDVTRRNQFQVVRAYYQQDASQNQSRPHRFPLLVFLIVPTMSATHYQRLHWWLQMWNGFWILHDTAWTDATSLPLPGPSFALMSLSRPTAITPMNSKPFNDEITSRTIILSSSTFDCNQHSDCLSLNSWLHQDHRLWPILYLPVFLSNLPHPTLYP